MALPEIFVLRHGETEWNRAARMQGGLDSALTQTGRQQAMDMAARLARAVGPQTHDLWSSPQGRAMATAEPIASLTGCVVQPVDDLREIAMGDWVGLDRAEIDQRWPATVENEHFMDFYARAPNAETFDALWNRVGRVLAGITRPTVIVTHGMTSRFLRTRAMGWGTERLRDLPGGQGEIYRIFNGQHEIYK